MKIEISHIRPCRSDKKKISLEAKTGIKIGPKRMCELLGSGFEDVKSSPKTGAAKIRCGKMEALVFNSGQIIIKMADSEQKAIKMVKEIVRVLGG